MRSVGRTASVLAAMAIMLLAPALAAAQSYQTDFPADEFRARHAQVFAKIGDNAVAVLQGVHQTEGFTLPRQHNSFYYLSGIETPGAYLLLDGRTKKVTIYLPPDDAVELEAGAPVNLLLHVDPLSPLEAKIERSSYEATLAPDGTLAYVIRAQLAQGQGLPRIGLRGTAKIYAGRVTLAYYLLRKPLAFMRRSLGI